jgi:hypothetical protein
MGATFLTSNFSFSEALLSTLTDEIMKDDVVRRVNMYLDHGDVVAAVANGGGDRFVRGHLHHFDNLRLLKRRHPAADHRLAL